MPSAPSSTASKLLCLLALVAAVCDCASKAQAGRYAITADDVARRLSSDTLPLTAENMQLPGSLTSRRPSPTLDVLEVTPVAPNDVRVRLRCHAAGDCLSFLAVVHVPAPRTAREFVATAENSPKPAPRQEAFPKLLAGEHTTLLLESAKMRIRLPVILIDTGGLGTEVRVASLDRKQTYRGRVVAPDEVQAELP